MEVVEKLTFHSVQHHREYQVMLDTSSQLILRVLIEYWPFRSTYVPKIFPPPEIFRTYNHLRIHTILHSVMAPLKSMLATMRRALSFNAVIWRYKPFINASNWMCFMCAVVSKAAHALQQMPLFTLTKMHGEEAPLNYRLTSDSRATIDLRIGISVEFWVKKSIDIIGFIDTAWFDIYPHTVVIAVQRGEKFICRKSSYEIYVSTRCE